MTIKSIYDTGYKEEYKKSPLWRQLNKEIGKYYKERIRLEEAIRNETDTETVSDISRENNKTNL